MADQIGRHTFVGTEFPAQRAGLPVDGVSVAFRQIGVENDEIVGDDRIAMEARVLIGSRIECPLNRTGVLVERVEESGAGSDEQLVPNDRWGDGESTACVVLPQDLEARRGGLRGVVRCARVRGNGNGSREPHAEDQPSVISRHRRSAIVTHTTCLLGC